MRWLGGITDSMDMILSKLGIDDGQGSLACTGSIGSMGSMGLQSVRHNWASELKC